MNQLQYDLIKAQQHTPQTAGETQRRPGEWVHESQEMHKCCREVSFKNREQNREVSFKNSEFKVPRWKCEMSSWIYSGVQGRTEPEINI